MGGIADAHGVEHRVDLCGDVAHVLILVAGQNAQ
jgi:hypothetical protein